ncbi:MAG TPA: hypothetical protein VGK32_21495 [Vicinamibacterales bacterium]|jgi:hypothetical protein
MSLREILLPDPPRRLPHARLFNVLCRTIHLAATGTLLGGHVFGVSADLLVPWLWLAIATGAALLAIELYGSLDWAFQLGGLSVVMKLAVLCAVPFAWNTRVPLLFAVVAIAGVGSHMSGRLRHYSLLYRRSMKAKG